MRYGILVARFHGSRAKPSRNTPSVSAPRCGAPRTAHALPHVVAGRPPRLAPAPDAVGSATAQIARALRRSPGARQSYAIRSALPRGAGGASRVRCCGRGGSRRAAPPPAGRRVDPQGGAVSCPACRDPTGLSSPVVSFAPRCGRCPRSLAISRAGLPGRGAPARSDAAADTRPHARLRRRREHVMPCRCRRTPAASATKWRSAARERSRTWRGARGSQRIGDAFGHVCCRRDRRTRAWFVQLPGSGAGRRLPVDQRPERRGAVPGCARLVGQARLVHGPTR